MNHTAKNHPADALLDEVAILQYAWKSNTMQLVAFKICSAALILPSLWPDDIDFSDVPGDSKNCIGSVFRVLRNMGLIQPTGDWRRSNADDAHGRVVWEYRVSNTALVRAMRDRTCPPKPENYSQCDLL